MDFSHNNCCQCCKQCRQENRQIVHFCDTCRKDTPYLSDVRDRAYFNRISTYILEDDEALIVATAMSLSELESQPRIENTSRPSTTPFTTSSTIPFTTPSTRPFTTPSTRPFTTPSTRPFTTPSTRPSTIPFTTPSTIPFTTPSTTPSTRPFTTPSTRPFTTPPTIPFTTPSTTPSTRPSTTPSTTPSTISSTSTSTSNAKRPNTNREFSRKVKNLSLALERKIKANKEARIKKDDTQSEDSRCPICFEGKQEYAFIKCGHVVCADCKPKLSLCPICRARIEGTLKIFI